LTDIEFSDCSHLFFIKTVSFVFIFHSIKLRIIMLMFYV